MKDASDDGTTRPLPRSWLPAPHPPEDDPAWDERAERIMAAARPELRDLGRQRPATEITWWSGMGRWWKPAAALAAASTVLVIIERQKALAEPTPASIPLGLIASAGDPVTLWELRGARADPVLALIAIREQADTIRPAAPSTIREEENR